MKKKQGDESGSPKRHRRAMNLTLSDTAREEGAKLAERRGLKFARLVEELIRKELRRVKILPPENED